MGPLAKPAKRPHIPAMPIALSILDQSSVVTGRGPDDAIRETLALARMADQWGYHRYWLAEHHNSSAHAGSAPEILISAIAATTRRIRVGSAGVMLPHYAALKVAEQFRVLEAIAPGRIDLGLGRAPGSDGRTAYALNPNAGTAADQFPQQIRDLQGWLGEGLPVDHPFRAVTANPVVPTKPELWILGSSDYGAQVAAFFGLPYCYAYFITDGAGSEQALELYHQGYRPSAANPTPNAALAVFALTAATEAEAHRLFSSRACAHLKKNVFLIIRILGEQEYLEALCAEIEFGLKKFEFFFGHGCELGITLNQQLLVRCNFGFGSPVISVLIDDFL